MIYLWALASLYLSVIFGKSGIISLEAIPYLIFSGFLFSKIYRYLFTDYLSLLTISSTARFLFGDPTLLLFAFKSTAMTLLIYVFFKYKSSLFSLPIVRFLFISSSFLNMVLIFLQYFLGIIWIPLFLRNDGILINVQALRPIGLLADTHASSFLNSFFIIYLIHLLVNRGLPRVFCVLFLALAFYTSLICGSYASLLACIVQTSIYLLSLSNLFIRNPIKGLSLKLETLLFAVCSIGLFSGPLLSLLSTVLKSLFDNRAIASIEIISYQLEYLFRNALLYIPLSPSIPPEIFVELGEASSFILNNRALDVGLEIGWFRAMYSYGIVSSIFLISITFHQLKHFRYYLFVVLFHYNHFLSNPLVFFYGASASFLISNISSSLRPHPHAYWRVKHG